ncbi:MAG: PAS domain S-box protein [Nitrincola sp.]|nr:PAS domain S-box protein [Nitrincola sp.]
MFLLVVGLTATSSIIFALVFVMRKRRQAEQEAKRFKSMADNALLVMCHDLKGNIIYVNQYFARVHGFKPDELVGQHVSIFHTHEQRNALNKVFDELELRAIFLPLKYGMQHVMVIYFQC